MHNCIIQLSPLLPPRHRFPETQTQALPTSLPGHLALYYLPKAAALGTILDKVALKKLFGLIIQSWSPPPYDFSGPIRQRTCVTFFSKFNYRMLISLPTT